MRKFAILVGIIMLMLGVRLHYNWISDIECEGELTVYTSSGETIEYGKLPTLINPYAKVRLEMRGDESTALDIMCNLEAEIRFYEELTYIKTEALSNENAGKDIIERQTIIYGYTHRIPSFNLIHNQKINVMISITSKNNLAVGIPLLYGSY